MPNNAMFGQPGTGRGRRGGCQNGQGTGRGNGQGRGQCLRRDDENCRRFPWKPRFWWRSEGASPKEMTKGQEIEILEARLAELKK